MGRLAGHAAGVGRAATMSLFAELKRRNVFRVGIAYVVAAWLLLQLTEVLTELLELSTDIGKIVIILLIVGFVPALIFAWAFEMTPEGLKREREVDRDRSITRQTGRKLDFTIIGMLVLVAAYFFWESRISGRSEPQPQPLPEVAGQVATPAPAVGVETAATQPDQRKSIVVLPFINMSNDPDQEFFSDGLSEEILNALVKIEGLRVISRTSAFAFKGKDLPIPEIAGRLGVSYVLEGSVRKAGNDVRITAQLIEAESDSHLWSEGYSRSLENVFEIQEEISLAIADQLHVALGERRQDSRPTDNIEAYQLFLRGRHLYQDRGADNVRRAVDVLKQAVALDPEFADAWANLAGASAVHGFQANEGHEALFEQGRESARRAIAIDPGNGFGHGVLGLLHMRNLEWESASSELDRAIELNPNETNSLLWKGILLCALGYPSEALRHFEQAETVDPVWPLLQNWLSSAYGTRGDIQSMSKVIEKAEQMSWGFQPSIHIWYWLLKGDLDRAEEAWAATDIDNIGTDVLARTTIAALRDPAQSEQSTATLLANEALSSYTTLVTYLWVVGATDEAIAALLKEAENKRGLRVVSNLSTVWNAYNRDQLADPGLPGLFERIGMADYWRRHGDPEFCRVDGDRIECGPP